MRTSELLRTSIGSFTVYVVVAACSASGGGSMSFSNGSTGGDISSGIGGNSTVVEGGETGQGGAEGASSTSIQSGGVSMTSNTRTLTLAGGTQAIGTRGSSTASDSTSITNPVPTAQAEPVSGTRLKAKYREGSDGSKEYLNLQWWDSQRKEDCSFQATADGDRCLPAASIFIGGSYFADSSCTTDLAIVARASCPGVSSLKYFMKATECAGYRIHEVGAIHTGPVYMKSGETCGDMTAALKESLSNFAFRPIGAEIPLSSFVGAATKVAS